MTGIPEAVAQAIRAHAEEAYPAECCGLLLADGAGGLRFLPIANVAGTAQAAGVSTRSAADGYVMDPLGLMAAQDEADRLGASVWAIVHSHPDVGAYFSAEDRRNALDDRGREPLWPGVHYLVISARAGGVDRACLYTWDPGARDFTEEEVPGFSRLS